MIRPWFLAALSLVLALVWRTAPWPLACAVAAVGIGGTWLWAFRSAVPPARVVIWVMAVAVAVTLSRVAGLWTCDLACEGGAYYQRLFGVSVLWPAATLYAVLASLAGVGISRPQDRRLALAMHLLAWAAIGASLYYLVVAVQLDLRCRHCLALHSVVLLPVGALLRGPLRWRERIGAVLLAALTLHALYHPQVRQTAETATDVEIPLPPAPALSDGNRVIYAHADGGRRRGNARAPYVIELAIDFQCSRCARMHGDLTNALEPALASGRVEVVTRHVARLDLPASVLLARWGYAAASENASTYAAYTAVMLGSRPEADVPELRARLAQLLNPDDLDRSLAEHGPAFERLLGDDARRLHELNAGTKTPEVILLDRATRREVKRWTGDVAIDEVVRAVGR